MMMDTAIDTDRTAFICPECSFNGTSLPELISHLNEAHGEGLLTIIHDQLFVCLIQKQQVKVKHHQKIYHQYSMKNVQDVNQHLVIKYTFKLNSFYFINFFSFRSFLKHHDSHYRYLNNQTSIQVGFFSFFTI